MLTSMFPEALDGSVKAPRLYFESTGNSQSATRSQTNNYLTTNNLTITKDDVDQLPEDEREQLEVNVPKAES